MLSELAFPHIRCCLSAIPSDLMKSTAVDESLSSMNQQFCSRENQLLQIKNLIIDISLDKVLKVLTLLHLALWLATDVCCTDRGYLPQSARQ